MSVFDIDDNLNDKVLFKRYLSDNNFRPTLSSLGATIIGVGTRLWQPESNETFDFNEFIQKHPEYVKYERFDKEILGNSGYYAYTTITYYPSQLHPEIAKNSHGKYKNILTDQIYNLGILYCNVEIYDRYKPEERHSCMKGINDYNDFFCTMDYINTFKQKIFNDYG
jgi:hypothetical protein